MPLKSGRLTVARREWGAGRGRLFHERVDAAPPETGARRSLDLIIARMMRASPSQDYARHLA